MIDVGEKLPNFTLFDWDLKEHNIGEWRGKKLVVAFFPGAFTGVCDKEMCRLRDDLAKLEKLDAQVVGISVNDPFSLKGFREANELNFPLLSDYTRETVRSYGIEMKDFAGLKGYSVAKRSIFVADADGVVRWKWITEDPRVEPPYEEIAKQLKAF